MKTSQNEKWIDRELSRLRFFQIDLAFEMGIRGELDGDVESYPVWDDCSKSCYKKG